MANDVSGVRSLVIAAVGAISGWTQSRFAPEFFGRDTDNLSHHAFAVGITETVPVSHDRQSLTDGVLVNSTVEVHWAHRLRGDAQSADYSAALDAEEDLVDAVTAIASRHILVTRLARTARLEGWVTGTATFQVQHRYTLA